MRDCLQRKNHLRGMAQKAGGAHAEKEAIDKIKDKSILEKSTLYVN